jgi:hypothetical protein
VGRAAIEVSGAGDRLPKVDVRIRRIKELARCTIASLDWSLPFILCFIQITYDVEALDELALTCSVDAAYSLISS